MKLHRKTQNPVRRLAVFPGAFDPLTIAHLELARAALDVCDEVLFVLPRRFPHGKDYGHTKLNDRLEMVLSAIGSLPRFGAAVSDGGLFVEICDECRVHFPEPVELFFLCGRDAAERILGWDYGSPQALSCMLSRFQLLVAPRGGNLSPPPEVQNRIHVLPIASDFSKVSSSEVRRRIAAGQPWCHLVPPEITSQVARLYGAEGATSQSARP